MRHLKWHQSPVIKKVKCLHTNAKKYIVRDSLTPGKIYDVIKETEEFYFIIDNSNRIAGYKKDYFSELV